MGAATTVTSKSSNQVVIKAAKKTLKRQGSAMKLKSLAKELLEKFEADNEVPSCKKTVSKWIEESDVFEIDGKMVMLKSKKRKSADDENAGDDAAKKVKKSKKDKKRKKESSSADLDAAPADNKSIQEWRKNNKIVLMDSRSGEEGAEETKKLPGNQKYYPFQTFNDPLCVEKIPDKLLKQCTEKNGFQKPSPIQAQCWVSFFPLHVCTFDQYIPSQSHSSTHVMFPLHNSPSFYLQTQTDVTAMLSELPRLAVAKHSHSPCRLLLSCPKTKQCLRNVDVLHVCSYWHPRVNWQCNHKKC
jgi:hypothetical protein